MCFCFSQSIYLYTCLSRPIHLYRQLRGERRVRRCQLLRNQPQEWLRNQVSYNSSLIFSIYLFIFIILSIHYQYINLSLYLSIYIYPSICLYLSIYLVVLAECWRATRWT